MSYSETYSRYSDAVEQALLYAIPMEDCPQRRVEDAMRYSLLSGGKHLRGVLTLAFYRLCGGTQPEEALPLACAVEMVHAYSLIHDDLPCMDNDDLRRGKPTCHKVYGEATALLAGDGLLTAAFTQLTDCGTLTAAQRLDAVAQLAKSAGTKGMIGGQQLDMEYEGKLIQPDLLRQLHGMKTGALITAAAQLGCIAAGAATAQRDLARQYSTRLGLIFQITDDLLDVTATVEELGKPIGSDAASGKTTYATLYGEQGSRQMVRELASEAKRYVAAQTPEGEFLRELLEQMEQRTK
ncbi:MAG: polyprenyl synthetase family protein [Angelakisella sp.]